MSRPFPVLLYHSVSDTPADAMAQYAVTPGLFRSHLDRLAELGMQVLTLGQVADHLRTRTPLPGGAVCLTFDDGLEDFGVHAWPELRQRGMPATLYTVAGYIGGHSDWLPDAAGRLPMLSGPRLRDLAADGVEMGAHSMTHPQLDLVSPDRARREIADSKDALEQLLGSPVTTFAYPHGHHTGRTRQLVVDAGYTSAAAVRNMYSHDGDDLFAVARLTITCTTTPSDIERLARGRGARCAPRRELMRTLAGRQLRRARQRTAAVR